MVLIDGSLSKAFICQLIDHSYDRVVDKLPQKMQIELANF